MTASMLQSCSPGNKWVKGPHGWHEYTVQSEILADSIPMSHVKKIIDLFLRSKQQKAFKRLYSCLSAAPVSKCSAKESVMWLQVSAQGSRECHGYSTLGELLRRLHITGSVSQQGRFNYVISLTELIVRKKFASLSGTSRRHLFLVIEALVQRVIETRERIRQMKRIVNDVMRCMMKKNYRVGSKGEWFTEVDRVRHWSSRLNIITIVPRVDTRLSLLDMPIEVQRHIIGMLNDHQDIESLSHVNKNLQHLCSEPNVWENLCRSQFTQRELKECETVLERRRQKSLKLGKPEVMEITWRVKYHFLLKRFEKAEEFADPLLLCHRCCIVFWKDSGHPCVGEGTHVTHEQITPKKLISYF